MFSGCNSKMYWNSWQHRPEEAPKPQDNQVVNIFSEEYIPHFLPRSTRFTSRTIRGGPLDVFPRFDSNRYIEPIGRSSLQKVLPNFSPKMTRTIIDEYALAKLMNKVCSKIFTDDWLREVHAKYISTFINSECPTELISNNRGDHLVVKCRLIDSTNTIGPLQSRDFNQEAIGDGVGISKLTSSSDLKNSIQTRVRSEYTRHLEEIVSFVYAKCQQQIPSQTDVAKLLQDIRTYFNSDLAPIQSGGSKKSPQQQQPTLFGDMNGAVGGTMSLESDSNDKRQRHFSSISDGSSSSESSNNAANYQQFENILQRIFKLIQSGASSAQNQSTGIESTLDKATLDLNLIALDAIQAFRQMESREELSSGYGRSSSASSSNDSANQHSIENPPTVGSLTVNIGSVLSDSGNVSPTLSFFRQKNSSSSGSSLNQESSPASNLKMYLDSNGADVGMKRERLNTNPIDEMFRTLNDSTISSSRMPARDPQMPLLTNASGLYFSNDSQYDPERPFDLPDLSTRQISSWLPATTLCQETNTYSPMNQCFVLSTGDRSMNRSFSVGARENSPIMSVPNRPEVESFSVQRGNFMICNRKKLYELIIAQLCVDGYQDVANQIAQAEGFLLGSVIPSSRLHSLIVNGLKNEASGSDMYLSQSEDNFFNSNDYEERPGVISPYDSSFSTFNRSNTISVTMPSSMPTVPPGKMFVSNRSQSQVVGTNSMNMAGIPSPQPLTAPALLDNNIPMSETVLKNISQLAMRLNADPFETQNSANSPSIPELINPPPMGASFRPNQINSAPSHTTGNGKLHRELAIKAKFGSLGSGINQFSSPHGFCLGFNEELVIADTSNHRICIYDKNGKYRSSFGTSGREEGQLFNPRKIATIVLKRNGVDTQCYVICDRGSERSRMQIFTRDGAFIRKILITFMEIVAGIVVNSRGHICVVDSVHPTVFTMNDKGNMHFFFDCSNHMCEPSDIAFADEHYYICDFKGHCIVVYDLEGNCIRKIGSQNNTYFPNGIDIAPNGHILVGDSHGNRFHMAIFDTQGNLITEYECPHVKVSRCCGLKLTREGYIVTLAKNNHHVLVLNAAA